MKTQPSKAQFLQTPFSKIWIDNALGGSLRRERHFGDRDVLCFSERPPTLFAMFADIVRRFGERPAIAGDDNLSYRALHDRVETIAAGLAHRGVAQGDRVALFLGNRWEFLASVFACSLLGAIVVPIGTRQRQAERNSCSTIAARRFSF